MSDLRHIDHDDPRMIPAAVEEFRADPLDVAATEIERYIETPTGGEIDVVLLTRGRLVEHKRRADELIKLLDAQVLMPMVKTAGGEIVVAPGVKWVTKYDKTVKPRKLRDAIEGIFLAVGGDFDRFVDTLSVNAVKPGEARKVLGDRFDELFETVVKEDVECKGPKKVLALINENFTK